MARRDALLLLRRLLLLFSMAAWLSGAAGQPACRPFHELYGSGEQLCNRIFGTAFKYTTELDKAYTMWFFDASNPNDNVSAALNLPKPDSCILQYYHKPTPTPEGDNFTECHPWKNNACCEQKTVADAKTLKEAYGPEFHWDRCGPLSQSCERFFVQEACFYECDPNAGLFRRFGPSIYDPNNETHNTWELYQLPVRADYCDAWFESCRNDFFCATDGGDFFSCAREYKALDSPTSEGSSGISPGAIAGIAIAVAIAGQSFCFVMARELTGMCCLLVALLVFVLVMIQQERRGRAMFSPLKQADAAPSPSKQHDVEMS